MVGVDSIFHFQATSLNHGYSIVLPVELETLEALLYHLGLSNMRARRLIALSKMYMEYPPNPRLVYKSKVVKDKTTIELPSNPYFSLPWEW
jgi:hypothetical protein